MRKQLLILTALLISVIGYSQTFTDTFITYSVSSTTANTVRVMNYNTAGGTAVAIPNTVTYNSVNYSVTSINDYAFEASNLNSVALSNSIISIGQGAFFINNLSIITIPNSVTSIGPSAFAVNPLTCVITEATTPPIISTINNNLDTFAADRSNINLTIPSGAASAYTAAQWTGFNSVAEVLNDTFVVDHITYQINATPNNEVTITGYNTTGGTTVDIPAIVTSGCTDFSVVSIGSGAFLNKGLTEVIIPDGITNIGGSAFRSNLLTSVTIPDSVINIDAGAFVFNTLLANLDLGNGITAIGASAFNNNDLIDIIIPNSVTSIGASAFGDNPSLSSVTSEATMPPAIITGGGTDTFGDRSNVDLIIPVNTTGTYVTDAGALWTGFKTVNGVVLSTSSFELANDVKVFTTTNTIKIVASNNLRLENYSVYSITGAKVSTGTENEIPTSTLSNGIYILKLDFDRGTVTKKILVK